RGLIGEYPRRKRLLQRVRHHQEGRLHSTDLAEQSLALLLVAAVNPVQPFASIRRFVSSNRRFAFPFRHPLIDAVSQAVRERGPSAYPVPSRVVWPPPIAVLPSFRAGLFLSCEVQVQSFAPFSISSLIRRAAGPFGEVRVTSPPRRSCGRSA